MYNRGQNNPSFSYILIYEHMGHNVKQTFIIGYSEALGGPSIIRQYQSTYKICKQYVQDFFKLSY